MLGAQVFLPQSVQLMMPITLLHLSSSIFAKDSSSPLPSPPFCMLLDLGHALRWIALFIRARCVLKWPRILFVLVKRWDGRGQHLQNFIAVR